MMNACPQASTAAAPVVVGAQGTSFAQLVFTAVVASDSAAPRYCSASTGDTLSACALLSKPRLTSSAGKPSAGAEVSPSRSWTVLLYSSRFTRRMYDGPGLGGPLAQSEPVVPTGLSLGAPIRPVHAPRATINDASNAAATVADNRSGRRTWSRVNPDLQSVSLRNYSKGRARDRPRKTRIFQKLTVTCAWPIAPACRAAMRRQVDASVDRPLPSMHDDAFVLARAGRPVGRFLLAARGRRTRRTDVRGADPCRWNTETAPQDQGAHVQDPHRQLAAAGGCLLGRGIDARAERFRDRRLHAAGSAAAQGAGQGRHRAARLQDRGARSGRAKSRVAEHHAGTRAHGRKARLARGRRRQRRGRRGGDRRRGPRHGSQHLRPLLRPPPDGDPQSRVQDIFGMGGHWRGRASYPRPQPRARGTAHGLAARDLGRGRRRLRR